MFFSMGITNGLEMRIGDSEPVSGRFELERGDGTMFAMRKFTDGTIELYAGVSGPCGVIEQLKISKGLGVNREPLALYRPYHDGAFIVTPFNAEGEPDESQNEITNPVDYLAKQLIPIKNKSETSR